MKISKLVTLLSIISLFVACSNNDEVETAKNSNSNLKGYTIKTDTTWSGTITAEGRFFVAPGVKLTVLKGSIVKFKKGTGGAIITMRATSDKISGQLIANGTAAEPIVFTSAEEKGLRAAQDWAGIVLCGIAYTNAPNGEGLVEGIPAADNVKYGGGLSPKNDDNSGLLRYVRIEYCGSKLESNNEINGLTLYACGSATTLEYIQVYKCSDDGFEFFGGSVNTKYLVSIYNDDDSFDMDQGYNGKSQFWFALQSKTATGADNGFECDGRHTFATNLGTASKPTIYNVTINSLATTNNDTTVAPGEANRGLRLREDFEGTLKNFVLSNFVGENFKLDTVLNSDETLNNYTSGSLVLNSFLLFHNNNKSKKLQNDNGGFSALSDSTKFLNNTTFKNLTGVTEIFENKSSNDYRLKSTLVGLPAASAKPADAFFIDAPYLGAFSSSASKWTDSWVRFSDADFN